MGDCQGVGARIVEGLSADSLSAGVPRTRPTPCRLRTPRGTSRRVFVGRKSRRRAHERPPPSSGDTTPERPRRIATAASPPEAPRGSWRRAEPAACPSRTAQARSVAKPSPGPEAVRESRFEIWVPPRSTRARNRCFQPWASLGWAPTACSASSNHRPRNRSRTCTAIPVAEGSKRRYFGVAWLPPTVKRYRYLCTTFQGACRLPRRIQTPRVRRFNSCFARKSNNPRALIDDEKSAMLS